MKKETVTTNQITEGVIWKQLLLFFFPIVLGTFFQQLYNTADTIVVGRFVSKEALAAVGGSAAQIVGLIVGFFVGLASGASVIISQFYGAKNRVQLNRALHTAYAFSIIGSIFITVLGILIAPWMLELMHTPQETMADALLYLRIYFAGIIFVFIYNVGSSILRAMGDSRRPVILSDRLLYPEYCAGYRAGDRFSHGSCRCVNRHDFFSGSQCRFDHPRPNAFRRSVSARVPKDPIPQICSDQFDLGGLSYRHPVSFIQCHQHADPDVLK